MLPATERYLALVRQGRNEWWRYLIGTLIILREPVEFRRRVGRIDAILSVEHEQLDIGSAHLELTRAVIRLRYTISG